MNDGMWVIHSLGFHRKLTIACFGHPSPLVTNLDGASFSGLPSPKCRAADKVRLWVKVAQLLEIKSHTQTQASTGRPSLHIEEGQVRNSLGIVGNPPKTRAPSLTVEQSRRRIERLQNCIRELEDFEPQEVQKRYGIPEVSYRA